jgi:hypothetical protein
MALICVRLALRERVSYSQAFSFFFILLYESIDQNSREKEEEKTQNRSIENRNKLYDIY